MLHSFKKSKTEKLACWFGLSIHSVPIPFKQKIEDQRFCFKKKPQFDIELDIDCGSDKRESISNQNNKSAARVGCKLHRICMYVPLQDSKVKIFTFSFKKMAYLCIQASSQMIFVLYSYLDRVWPRVNYAK